MQTMKQLIRKAPTLWILGNPRSSTGGFKPAGHFNVSESMDELFSVAFTSYLVYKKKGIWCWFVNITWFYPSPMVSQVGLSCKDWSLCFWRAKRSKFGVKQLQGSKWLFRTNRKWKCLRFFRRLFSYLEDEHLSPQYAQGVEAPIADVGFGIGVGWPVSWGQPRRSRLPVWLAGVWWRMGARRGCCRQRHGGLGKFIRRPCRKPRQISQLFDQKHTYSSLNFTRVGRCISTKPLLYIP